MVAYKKYSKKKPMYGKGKKPYARRPAYTGKSLVSLIKKVSLRTQETKHVIRSILNNSPIFHNSFNRIAANLCYSEQGITDSGTNVLCRIGDTVTPVGVKLFVQLTQPSDRPNVTFKLVVVKFWGGVNPPVTIPQIGISGCVMLDPLDTEKCSVVKSWDFKAGDNYYNGTAASSKQMGKFFTLWLPLPKKPFVYAGDNSTLGKTYQLSLGIAAFDVQTTLPTDVIGYVSIQSQFYFKDG